MKKVKTLKVTTVVIYITVKDPVKEVTILALSKLRRLVACAEVVTLHGIILLKMNGSTLMGHQLSQEHLLALTKTIPEIQEGICVTIMLEIPPLLISVVDMILGMTIS